MIKVLPFEVLYHYIVVDQNTDPRTFSTKNSLKDIEDFIKTVKNLPRL